ncbi:MAG: choice-of-anchor I family protein [Burkholderiales bacterium]
MKKRMAFLMVAAATLFPAGVMAVEPAVPAITFSKLWTHSHTAIPGQVSEISAFDRKTNTLWVAGVVGVDVLDAGTGELVEHIDITSYGAINSVAIHNGLAAFAVEAAPDRRNPGMVLFYDTRTRLHSGPINAVPVGPLPDMLTFTHNGRKLLVANEGTPNAVADTPYVSPDPAGSVSIIDVETRSVIATATLAGVPVSGDNARTNTGMDFEPEYIAVDEDDRKAYVTLQEGNAMAVLDLRRHEFTRVFGLGAKDFSQPGNQIDPLDTVPPVVGFLSPDAKGLYMPDGLAVYERRGKTYLVMANEGDFREDNADRVAASTLGAVAPLNRLRVSSADSSAGNLFAAGARSFSIRNEDGGLVYDSGDFLDKKAAELGIYDDSRSRDKGVEPEGVALLDIAGRTYAFIGLERTLKGAVAVFDITRPTEVRFVDIIVTDGDVSPEGLAAYQYRGDFFLAIANEVSRTTTLYKIEKARRHSEHDD